MKWWVGLGFLVFSHVGKVEPNDIPNFETYNKFMPLIRLRYWAYDYY